MIYIQSMNSFAPAKSCPSFINLSKLKEGDKVSVVASSAQIVSAFPHVYELGLTRLRDLFKLVPVELPTTRASGSSLEERARDLMSAFKDHETRAVISLIGGSEQIKLLKFLDPRIFLENPKPFFGYSDNTSFGLYLWSLGIPSYYGGCIFTEYAMLGTVNPYTEKYLRLALFESGEIEILPATSFSDQDILWEDPSNITKEYEYEPNQGWFWDGSGSSSGILWGGCLEVLGHHLMADKWLPAIDATRGSILCLETSELIPESWYTSDVMVALGERGYLDHLSGLLVARPKARAIGKEPCSSDRENYREQQRNVILKEFRRYNRSAPVVMNFDFGHTKPQIPLPMGKIIKIDAISKKIIIDF